MKILFICKFNRFRSKVAESIFKKINDNKKINAISAGIIRGSPLDKNQVKIGRELGFLIKSKPKGITSKMLAETDYHIIVADDVPKILLKDSLKYGKKLILWKIPDAKTNNKKEIEKIIFKIKNNVEKLLRDLK